jgi:hypothetical protein
MQMKYFSSTSTRLYTVRKEGYYPSARVASRLVERLQVVMQWSETQSSLARVLLTLGLPSYEKSKELFGHLPYEKQYGLDPYVTYPAGELNVLQSLVSWWSMDTEELRDERCFTVCDLNRGVSLCIVSK